MERPELRGWILAAGGVIVALALVAGWLAGGRARPTLRPAAPAPRTASAAPRAWRSTRRGRRRTRIPGLAGPATAKSAPPSPPRPASAAYAIAGLDPVDDATLHPGVRCARRSRARCPPPRKSKLLGSARVDATSALRPARRPLARGHRASRRRRGVVSPSPASRRPASWIAAQGCAAGVRALSPSARRRAPARPSAGLVVRARLPARRLDARRAPRDAARRSWAPPRPAARQARFAGAALRRRLRAPRPPSSPRPTPA